MIPLKIEIPEGFLNEEERCGFNVSAQMKEVWAIELDLMTELLRVCRKYNIQCVALAGTVLGAVRHKGFIPWDDDIDFVVSRRDYNKLCEIGPKEFNSPYFFQTEYTDPGSLSGHAQLRNSGTTAILKRNLGKNYKYNQGIFVDIFVNDTVVEDESKLKKQLRTARFFRNFSHLMAYGTTRFYKSDNFFIRLGQNILHLISPIIQAPKIEKWAYRRFEKECSRYNDEKSEFYSTISFSFSKRHYNRISDYNDVVEVPFEFLTIPICRNYEHTLALRYGDWRKFEKGTSYHGNVFFDTNMSYLHYIE